MKTEEKLKTEEKFLSQKLLVEGNNDKHVVWSLIDSHSVNKSFDVLDRGSVYPLIDSIPVTLKQSEIKTLGVIVDADFDIERRWQELKKKFTQAGCSLPDKPVPGGFIGSTSDKPIKKVGIWIMPNNTLPGMLEDFLHMLIPEDDNLLEHCDQFLSTIEEQELNRYKNIHKAKARIHTWLAVQEDPGTPMGQAITKKYLTTDNPICQRFIHWINLLFNPHPSY